MNECVTGRTECIEKEKAGYAMQPAFFMTEEK